MKITVLTGPLIALALLGCQKPPPAEPLTTPVPTPATPIPATPLPTPPAPATPAPSATLAPPGVFYLIAAVRVETNDGITGLTPGTGVKLVKPGIYLTPAGEVPLDEMQLTNDMSIARQARDSYRTAQAATHAAMAEDQQAAQAQQAGIAAPAMADGLGARTAKLSQIKLQIIALQAKISELDAQKPKQHAGRIESSSITEQKRALEQQMRQLETQQRLIQASPQ